MTRIISAASIALITFMVAGTPAKVQQPQAPPPRNFNFTGATLQASCVYEDKREKNQMNLLNSTTATFNAMGVCQGFIMGVAMSDIDAGYVVISGPPTPAATLNAVVIEYMKEHPEKLNQSALTVVRNALEQAYPAPAQNSNQQQ